MRIQIGRQECASTYSLQPWRDHGAVEPPGNHGTSSCTLSCKEKGKTRPKQPNLPLLAEHRVRALTAKKQPLTDFVTNVSIRTGLPTATSRASKYTFVIVWRVSVRKCPCDIFRNLVCHNRKIFVVAVPAQNVAQALEILS